MNEQVLDTLRQRVDRLERHNRYLRLAGFAMLVAVIAVGVIGRATAYSSIVEAKEFILKDTRGEVRASLGLGGSGSPVLRFDDGDGRTRIVFGIVNGVPQAKFADRSGKIVWDAR